jgi:hypothetical protein
MSKLGWVPGTTAIAGLGFCRRKSSLLLHFGFN